MATKKDLLERLTYKGQVQTTAERVTYTINRRIDEDAFTGHMREPEPPGHKDLVNARTALLLSWLVERLQHNGTFSEDDIDDLLWRIAR